MKTILLFCFAFAFTLPAKSQTFELTDTTFEVGDILIADVYFDLDKWQLLPENKMFLDKFVDFMGSYPKLRIEIGVHTDSRADHKYNDNLSEKRAMSIKDYLVSENVDEVRLKAVGYGERKPLINNNKLKKMKTKEEIEQAHQTNRRTEFKITSID